MRDLYTGLFLFAVGVCFIAVGVFIDNSVGAFIFGFIGGAIVASGAITLVRQL